MPIEKRKLALPQSKNKKAGVKRPRLFKKRDLPASSAATAAAVTTTATAAAVTTTAAATTAATFCARSGFIYCEGSAAELFAVCGIDSSLHVLFGDLYESEALVADDSDFSDGSERLKESAYIVLGSAVGHVAYVK
jgi:hypothetical protein